MSTIKTAFSALLAFSALYAAPAHAQDYITVAAGGYNALRSSDNSVLYGAEYRAEEVMYGVRPIAGAFGTTDGGAYGYVGINWDVALIPNKLFLVPNFAVGAYRNGGGKDLGGTIEFRSGIELDYQLPNQHQIGIALNHLSNAGIYKHNSGEENVIATYSIPVSAFR